MFDKRKQTEVQSSIDGTYVILPKENYSINIMSISIEQTNGAVISGVELTLSRTLFPLSLSLSLGVKFALERIEHLEKNM